MLLRGRWLYLALGAVVALLYLRLFMSGPIKSSAPAEMTAVKTEPSMSLWQLELTPSKLLEALQQKPHVASVLGLWMFLIIGIGLGGVALNIWTAWKGNLKLLFHYRARLPGAWSLGELIRLVLLLVLVSALLPFAHISALAWGPGWLADSHLWSVLSMFVLDGLLMLAVWSLAQANELSLSASLGISWRAGPRVILKALAGYAGLFPWIFGLLWFLVTICHELGIRPPLEPVHELLFMEERGLIVGLTVVLACVVGPVAEEIFFRGLLFAAVRKRASRLVAMLISSALFAAVHTNLVGFLPILLLGCLLADLYERTGSLLASIVVHVLHNTLLVGFALTLKALIVG